MVVWLVCLCMLCWASFLRFLLFLDVLPSIVVGVGGLRRLPLLSECLSVQGDS